jgi:probable addiction module antidote protein
MPKRTGDFDAWLFNELTNPRVAASYVNAAIEEDPDLLPVVLRDVAKAHRMAKVAEEANLARESVYDMLSDAGNPTLESLNGILKAVGLKIQVAPEVVESTPEACLSLSTGNSGVFGKPPDASEILGKAADIGVGVSSIGQFLILEQQPGTDVFTLSARNTFLAQSTTLNKQLAEEKILWNPAQLQQIGLKNRLTTEGSLTGSFFQGMPTTLSSNQQVGT